MNYRMLQYDMVKLPIAVIKMEVCIKKAESVAGGYKIRTDDKTQKN